ncbi:MAG: hypothetical protein JNM70_21445, partial [Anaerolineae bacterium]|nr:hypothetical protein [Anaerolineae bacterium]
MGGDGIMIYHQMRVQADQRRHELAAEAERNHHTALAAEVPAWSERLMEPIGRWLISTGKRIEGFCVAQRERRRAGRPGFSAPVTFLPPPAAEPAP